MRLAVVGSRSFRDYTDLEKTLSFIHKKVPITRIISGGAKGADSLAEQWARENSVDTQVFIPDWETYGKRAGFLRNKQIVDYSEAVVVFWDGKSKGSQHSMKLAKEQGKSVLIRRF